MRRKAIKPFFLILESTSTVFQKLPEVADIFGISALIYQKVVHFVSPFVCEKVLKVLVEPVGTT